MDEQPTTAEPQVKSRRRWYQFSLRTLLIVVTLVGCGLGWLGFKVREARRQEVAVAAIEKLGGQVAYDDQFDSLGNYVGKVVPPGPAWLRELLGNDFFRNVRTVDLTLPTLRDADLDQLQWLSTCKWLNLGKSGVTDAGLPQVKELTQLNWLLLANTQVSDAGLENLKGLAQLQTLDLRGTRVTAAGVKKLQQALPNCEVTR